MDIKLIAERILETEDIIKELELEKLSIVTPFEESGDIKPKVVWKYDCYLQAALYRSTDISKETLSLWKETKPVTAVILARSLMETVAAVYWLVTRVEKKIVLKNFSGIDEDVMRLSFNNMIPDELLPVKTINVMDCIRSLDKLVPGFNKVYGILSEASHPNHLGTLYSYSKIDKETRAIKLFDTHPDAESFLANNLPSALTGSLDIMKIALNKYNNLRPQLLALALANLKQSIKAER